MAESFAQRIAQLCMIQRAVDRMAGEGARMKRLGLVTIGALG